MQVLSGVALVEFFSVYLKPFFRETMEQEELGGERVG